MRAAAAKSGHFGRKLKAINFRERCSNKKLKSFRFETEILFDVREYLKMAPLAIDRI